MEDIINAARSHWRSRGESQEIAGRRFLFKFNSASEKEHILNQQPWVILGQTLIMEKLTEEKYMLEPNLTQLPLRGSFSGLPLDYLCWEAVIGIANMVGRADEDTPTHGHARRNRGYNTKIWFDTQVPPCRCDGHDGEWY